MEAHVDDVLELTRRLVRVPSVLGREGEVAALVAREMEGRGFDPVRRDAVGNVIGVIAGARAGPTLLLDGHLDTVDVEPREAWTQDPFGGALVAGRVYGRGSSDMKGALAAMLAAAASLDRGRLAGRVVVSASVEEERIEGRALREVMEREEPDLVVIGESSRLDVVRAGRGRAEFVLETRGKPAHASTPELGDNAVVAMLRWTERLQALPHSTHPFLGRSTRCLTDIVSTPYPAHSVVPSGCRATWERRLLPGDTLEGVRAEFEEEARRAGVAGSVQLARARLETHTGVRWDEPKWLPPWEIPEDHPLVSRALAAVRTVHPGAGLAGYRFCTNAAYSAGVAEVPTIGFGPSDESLAHVVDEYVEVEQLWAACRGYRAICEALLG